VLVGAPELFRPPTALAGALDEWAEVAAAVCANGDTDPATAELVSARGRQLAARLAAVTGTAVGYSDPVRGVLEHVPVGGAAVPLPRGEPPLPRVHPAEPTPWATGLTVSAFVAAVVLVAVVTLVRGLGEVVWWLGALGLVMVTAGLAPSIWLARHTPMWRWLSYGVAAGLVLSWVSVLLSTLGP
jgi:hypothetical protein